MMELQKYLRQVCHFFEKLFVPCVCWLSESFSCQLQAKLVLFVVASEMSNVHIPWSIVRQAELASDGSEEHGAFFFATCTLFSL